MKSSNKKVETTKIKLKKNNQHFREQTTIYSNQIKRLDSAITTKNTLVGKGVVIQSGTSLIDFQKSQTYSKNNVDNTFGIEKVDIELNKMIDMKLDNYNNEYTMKDIEDIIENTDFKNKMMKIYRGYDKDLNFNRVLLITHPGFIMEFFNAIRIKKNIRIKFINDSKQSSLYIIKIYCGNCGNVCYSKDQNCKLEFDVILYNDIQHLAPLINTKINN